MTDDAGNARSERGAADDGQLIPGTSLVMHRFPSGSLQGTPWIGEHGIERYDIENDRAVREIAAALAVWTEDQRKHSGANGIFDRNAYVPPDNIFEQMRMAQRAVENDDTVGGTVDAMEGLALKKIRWESTDLDDADIFNQWAAVVDLDAFARSAWRELCTVSQYVAARWWGFHDFKVRGRMPGEVQVDPQTGETKVIPGRKRRKEYKGVYMPTGLTILDSTRVIPMGSLMFGQQRLMWTATKEEMVVWKQIQEGTISRQADPVMANFFVGEYIPSLQERAMMKKLGLTDGQQLLEMNPLYVWRHTLTRPDYKPWADVRMKRVFRWLDMKQQLMAADRVSLIGNANYILLVRKGEKDNPATQPELDQLNENFAYVARLPVIIGDHTLQIDIITPKADHTLDGERYGTIDTRIVESLMQTFSRAMAGSGNRGSRDTTLSIARAIARGLDNRRHGMKRDFEANLARMVVNHPFNDDRFAAEPNLVFSPRNINLEQDAQTLSTLVALNAKGDVSRTTVLEEALDLDIETEAQRREMEAERYDDIFKTHVPFDGNDPNGNGMGPGGMPGNDGGPGNNGGGPDGSGGRPRGGATAKKAATPKTPSATKTPRAPRGKNR